jgi:hypothetical protein
MTDLRTELADARNVLLCAPSMSGDERGACTDLLVPDDPDEATVLWVSFRRDPRACVDQWVDATGDQPRDGGVIFVSESGATDVDGVTVETISSPSDLTGLGIAIGEFIGEAEGDPVVCVDSLTAMLQYVTVETAYEFLHTITGQLYAADASAHFHIDPTAHDDQTVDSIASLFDAVVTLGGDEPETRTRNVLE